ncbi:hypothetical protein HYW84_01880 [Candidatus Peregrinibacteria bacterium]|nr:hypothetical protein [Candidatus Peregrinibacteria bacterium]
MQGISARIGKFSLWNAVRDARVRSGVYLWFLIAGLCVILANAVAAGM